MGGYSEVITFKQAHNKIRKVNDVKLPFLGELIIMDNK